MSKNKLKFEWSIPNAISIFRIVLIPIFAYFYLKGVAQEDTELLFRAVVVLGISGLTDMFDGLIARKFNQITEIGKFLDPLADKLTQFAVLLCLSVEYAELMLLALICFIKEVLQLIGFFVLYSKIGSNGLEGSKWFGRISTFVFYSSMLLIVFWVNMPIWLYFLLVIIVGALMLFSFYRYFAIYRSIKTDIT